jgi:PAS domain-containing protein
MSEGERSLDNIDQIIEQIRALAKFPSENPNPVLRVTGAGRVLYANEAAHGIKGLLVGRSKDSLAKRLSDTAAKAAKAHSRQNVEFESEDRAYAFVLAPVAGESYINLYGRDITEEREAARQVEDLAKFPSENTAPIFRVDSKGAVIYANEATHKVKGLVVGRGKDRAYKELARVATKVFRKKEREVVEFPSEGRVFALAVTPVPDRHYLNVYGRDITAEKQAKQELIDANEHLEERVAERTASVHLLQNIVIAANEATSVEEALKRCLDEVCAYTGWPVGHAFLLAEDGSGEMAATDIWHLDQARRFKALREVTQNSRFKAGVGLPGRVLKAGKAVWIEDVTKDKGFRRGKLAKGLGVKAAMAYPVRAQACRGGAARERGKGGPSAQGARRRDRKHLRGFRPVRLRRSPGPMQQQIPGPALPRHAGHGHARFDLRSDSAQHRQEGADPRLGGPLGRLDHRAPRTAPQPDRAAHATTKLGILGSGQ